MDRLFSRNASKFSSLVNEHCHSAKAQDYTNVDGNVWNFCFSAKLCPC